MDIQKAPNINSLWAALIVEELVRNGVRYFCIAPGSRSAPLTVAVALHKHAESFVHFDERGLAFHALGYVSATRKPAALICTSGTAAANFLPAIVEASKKKLPLIVLTADRPPELQKTGADQTIDQVGIYGTYAKWEFPFPCPTQEIKAEFILTTIDQAVYQAKSGTPGVVHLNCMYREPLAPVKRNDDFRNYLIGVDTWLKTGHPYTTYAESKITCNFSDTSLLQSISEIKNGLIAVGKLNTAQEQDTVLRLAEKLNWPIFADITSGLRLGKTHGAVIQHYSQMILPEDAQEKYQFDGVLHLGGRMCPRRYYHFTAHIKPKHYITVLPHPLRNDPSNIVSLRIQSPISDFCDFLLQNLKQRPKNTLAENLKIRSQKIAENIDRILDKEKRISEIHAARIVSRLAPANSGLFLASSMPIRDMDMYAVADGPPLIVGANRGASGIDGTVASAIGFAKALNRPATLIIGDLAALYDLNSLGMAKELTKPFVIVILNNNGGGIFHMLPIAEHSDVFEKYFGTPHNLHFKEAAKMFDLNYKSPASSKDFAIAYKQATGNKKTTILEIKTNRAENAKAHQELHAKTLGS